MAHADQFTINLNDEAGRLEYAQQIYQRFCEDMAEDAGKAKTRLIAQVQIAMREAVNGGHIEPLFWVAANGE